MTLGGAIGGVEQPAGRDPGRGGIHVLQRTVMAVAGRIGVGRAARGVVQLVVGHQAGFASAQFALHIGLNIRLVAGDVPEPHVVECSAKSPSLSVVVGA